MSIFECMWFSYKIVILFPIFYKHAESTASTAVIMCIFSSDGICLYDSDILSNSLRTCLNPLLSLLLLCISSVRMVIFKWIILSRTADLSLGDEIVLKLQQVQLYWLNYKYNIQLFSRSQITHEIIEY